MPFDDTRDFNEARKGFIAPLNSMIIEADAGHVAWDVKRYEFLSAEEGWPLVHPSLQRQGALNQLMGLFEVTDGVYQVRGLDLANITFVRGKKGWIVFDPLTALETARAGLNYAFTDHLGIGISYNYFELNVGVDDSDWSGKAVNRFDGAYIFLSGYW